MGLSRSDLEAFRGGTLPDLIGTGTRLLFVGFNPGLRSVAVQAPFALRSNRFWPALFRSGILDRDIIATSGLRDEDRAYVIERGVGLTSLVKAATARASELTAEQLTRGGASLDERIRANPPHLVAILGVTAFRIAFAEPKAGLGSQSRKIGGVPTWVVPNPSGLNAHATLDSLATAYREVAIAAGIDVFPR